MSHSSIGLLPFYFELYDRVWPELRRPLESFCETVAGEIRKRDVQVLTSPVCRLRSEFEAALQSIERSGVDAIVTLHLAYSPSLESAPVLAASPIPLIVLDTTPAYSFGFSQSPPALLLNHGIHGVQDFCNLLLRLGKHFEIEAGHWEKSDVLDRVAARVRACRLASAFRRARVGRIGRAFSGMGDIDLADDALRGSTGIEIMQAEPEEFGTLVKEIRQPEIEDEIRKDWEIFQIDGVDREAHAAAAGTCLAVRRWMERNQLSAFTFNFLDIDRQCGLPTVPFLEACKAMARGQGYAGEGDVLTAALLGCLSSVYPDSSFVEMFCPDWERDAVFLSHMGEMNHRLAADLPRLTVGDFPFADITPPVRVSGRFRDGSATLVDLAPLSAERFRLIAAPVTLLDAPAGDSFTTSVRGWFKHASPVGAFLAEYSRKGGTHHLALVYGDVVPEVSGWGRGMGWDVAVL